MKEGGSRLRRVDRMKGEAGSSVIPRALPSAGPWQALGRHSTNTYWLNE